MTKFKKLNIRTVGQKSKIESLLPSEASASTSGASGLEAKKEGQVLAEETDLEGKDDQVPEAEEKDSGTSKTEAASKIESLLPLGSASTSGASGLEAKKEGQVLAEETDLEGKDDQVPEAEEKDTGTSKTEAASKTESLLPLGSASTSGASGLEAKKEGQVLAEETDLEGKDDQVPEAEEKDSGTSKTEDASKIEESKSSGSASTSESSGLQEKTDPVFAEEKQVKSEEKRKKRYEKRKIDMDKFWLVELFDIKFYICFDVFLLIQICFRQEGKKHEKFFK